MGHIIMFLNARMGSNAQKPFPYNILRKYVPMSILQITATTSSAAIIRHKDMGFL